MRRPVSERGDLQLSESGLLNLISQIFIDIRAIKRNTNQYSTRMYKKIISKYI